MIKRSHKKKSGNSFNFYRLIFALIVLALLYVDTTNIYVRIVATEPTRGVYHGDAAGRDRHRGIVYSVQGTRYSFYAPDGPFISDGDSVAVKYNKNNPAIGYSSGLWFSFVDLFFFPTLTVFLGYILFLPNSKRKTAK